MRKKYIKGIEHQKKIVAKIIKQISGDIENIDGDLVPEYIIAGYGTLYCYEPSTRTFVNVERGTTAFIVDYCTNERVLIYTYTNHILEIDIKDLQPLGFC